MDESYELSSQLSDCSSVDELLMAIKEQFPNSRVELVTEGKDTISKFAELDSSMNVTNFDELVDTQYNSGLTSENSDKIEMNENIQEDHAEIDVALNCRQKSKPTIEAFSIISNEVTVSTSADDTISDKTDKNYFHNEDDPDCLPPANEDTSRDMFSDDSTYEPLPNNLSSSSDKNNQNNLDEQLNVENEHIDANNLEDSMRQIRKRKTPAEPENWKDNKNFKLREQGEA